MPQVDPNHTQNQTSYTLRQLTKAGLVFAGTVGTFLGLKTTGSFGLIYSWIKNSKSEIDSGESGFVA